MLRLLFIVFVTLAMGSDCWRPIILNTQRNYEIKNEGRSYRPLYLENEEIIQSNLIIDADSARVIRMTTSVPLNDTIVIKLFDNEESFAHAFDIVVIKDQYLIRYSREINFTDLIQKFEPVKTKLELNSLDFSKGSRIRGHIEYTGKCISGCTDKNKKVRIEGNFAVKIYRY